jgi:hypothetical protein
MPVKYPVGEDERKLTQKSSVESSNPLVKTKKTNPKIAPMEAPLDVKRKKG